MCQHADHHDGQVNETRPEESACRLGAAGLVEVEGGSREGARDGQVLPEERQGRAAHWTEEREQRY